MTSAYFHLCKYAEVFLWKYLMLSAFNKLNDDEKKEYWAALALRHAKNIGIRSSVKLIRHFGSAYTAITSLEQWDEVALLHKKDNISNQVWRQTASFEWENAHELNADIILWTSPLYPAILKEIPDPPLCFYCLGNLDLLKAPSIAVIGSRLCSQVGVNVAHYMAQALSACGVTIVSGMARGIDRAAHDGALLEKGSSIGVLGSGIDVIYPHYNNKTYLNLKAKGLLLSEVAPGTPPDPTTFPIRNRIISGLSHGTLIIESKPKSGSMITARLAVEQNRSVYTTPGGVGSSFSFGCQELLRNGAKAVFHAEDILEELLFILKTSPNDLVKCLQAKKLDSKTLFDQNSVFENSYMKSLILNYEDTLPNIPTQDIIIQEKKPEKPKSPPKFNLYAENSPEYSILSLFADTPNRSYHIDTLCQHFQISAAELVPLLIQMEMQDAITRQSGSWFRLYE